MARQDSIPHHSFLQAPSESTSGWSAACYNPSMKQPMFRRLKTVWSPSTSRRAKSTGAAALGWSSSGDQSLIVPLVKGIDQFSSEEAALQLSADDSPVMRPFTSDLVILYAIDRPSHFEFVAMREIKARQLSVEELHDLAVSNLPSRVSQVEVHDLGGGMHGLSAGGNLEASLLLVDSLWDQLAARLPGEPLAAVPARDLLFTIGSGQPDAMELISSRARIALAEKRYAISQSVLVRRVGRWQAVGH